MTCTAAIAHGHLAALVISESYVMADSSRTAEILMHVLNRIAQQGVDLRAVELVVQSDNSSKEGKNNTVARMVSMLVQSHRLARCELRYLESGHSHEDVDAFFGVVAGHIEQFNEVLTPEAFMTLLQGFMALPSVRPLESLRFALKMDSVRDWTLAVYR